MGFFCNFRRVLAESNFSLLLLKLLSILKSALSCASQDCLHCLRATQCSKLTGLTGLPACSVMSDSFLLQGIFPTQGFNPHVLHCRQILSFFLNFFFFFTTEPLYYLQHYYYITYCIINSSVSTPHVSTHLFISSRKYKEREAMLRLEHSW